MATALATACGSTAGRIPTAVMYTDVIVFLASATTYRPGRSSAPPSSSGTSYMLGPVSSKLPGGPLRIATRVGHGIARTAARSCDSSRDDTARDTESLT